MKQRYLPILFLCWLAYFTVPLINNIGVFNGVYVMLCATKGVMIHQAPTTLTDVHAHHHNHHDHQQMLQSVADSGADQLDQTADDHEALGCPCIHFFCNIKFHLETQTALLKAAPPAILHIQAQPSSKIYRLQARGPPSYQHALIPLLNIT